MQRTSFRVRNHGHGLIAGSVHFQTERRARSGDNSVTIVVILNFRDDRHGLVVGDEPSGKFRNELKRKNVAVSAKKLFAQNFAFKVKIKLFFVTSFSC